MLNSRVAESEKNSKSLEFKGFVTIVLLFFHGCTFFIVVMLKLLTLVCVAQPTSYFNMATVTRKQSISAVGFAVARIQESILWIIAGDYKLSLNVTKVC